MARLRPAQTNFTQGEVSPILYGRPDLKAYANGCKRLRNAIAMPQGGAFRRWGTRYVGNLETVTPVNVTLSASTVGTGRTFTTSSAYWITTDVGRTIASGNGRATITGYTSATVVTATITVEFSTTGPITAASWSVSPARKARLLPFVFSATDAKAVCCNADFLTYYSYTALGVPQAVAGVRNGVTGITEAQLPDIQFDQVGDILTMVNSAWHPKSLSRLASDDSSWQFTSSPIDIPATYEAGDTYGAVLTISDASVGTGRNLNIASPYFVQSDVGRFVSFQSGRALITAYTDTSNVTVTVLSAFPSVTIAASTWLLEGSAICYLGGITTWSGYTIPVGTQVAIASYDTALASVTAFRSTDVGKYLYVDGGVYYINSVASASSITAICMRSSDHAVGTYRTNCLGQYGIFTIETVAWSATNGYPNACAVHQQRQIYAGSTEFPNTIWGGPTGDFFSIGRGVLDGDGFTHALGSGRADVIRVLSSGRTLGVGTVGEVHTLNGDSDGIITPTAAGAKDSESGIGVAPISPVRMSGRTIFAARTKRSVHGIGYDLASDGYQVANLSQIANHLLDIGQAKEMAAGVLEGPVGEVPIVWVLLADSAGTLLGLTYDTKEQVIAWHVHTAADSGIIESVCCIPNPATGYDETWLIVNRTINGTVTRMVEVLTADYYLDCAIAGTMTSGPTITGLTHLIGETVSIRARRTSDSVWRLYPDAVVNGSGGASVAENVNSYQVGLTFTGTVQTLALQPPGVSAILGSPKGWSDIRAKVYQTSLVKIGAVQTGEYSPIGYSASTPYTIPTAADQDLAVSSLGYDAEGCVTITMDLPVPVTLLAIYGKVDIGD